MAPPPRTPPLPWPAVGDDPAAPTGSTAPAWSTAPTGSTEPIRLRPDTVAPNPPSANPAPLPPPGQDPATFRPHHPGTAHLVVPGQGTRHTAPYRPLDQGPPVPAPGFAGGWDALPPRSEPDRWHGPDRRRSAVAAIAVVLILLAGTAVVAGVLIGGGDEPQAPDAGAAPAGSATAPVGGDLAAGSTVVDGAAFGGDPLRFRSPTGNIGCVLGSAGVRCDVTERAWQPPPAPADCTAGWGAGLSVNGTAPGGPTCGGETVADPSATPLDYGQALRNGDLTCVSRRTGVECRNAVTGHGFSASRSSYETY